MSEQIAVAFSVVFGVVPGYAFDTGFSEGTDPHIMVASAWREAMEEEFEKSGIQVGAAVTPGRVVYPTKFGCPPEGEIIAVVTGNSNPKFTPAAKLDEFQEAVIRVATRTMERLKQVRIQITFSEVTGFVYIEPASSGGEQSWGL
jgi:hypothetical protein